MTSSKTKGHPQDPLGNQDTHQKTQHTNMPTGHQIVHKRKCQCTNGKEPPPYQLFEGTVLP